MLHLLNYVKRKFEPVHESLEIIKHAIRDSTDKPVYPRSLPRTIAARKHMGKVGGIWRCMLSAMHLQ